MDVQHRDNYPETFLSEEQSFVLGAAIGQMRNFRPRVLRGLASSAGKRKVNFVKSLEAWNKWHESDDQYETDEFGLSVLVQFTYNTLTLHIPFTYRIQTGL